MNKKYDFTNKTYKEVMDILDSPQQYPFWIITCSDEICIENS